MEEEVGQEEEDAKEGPVEASHVDVQEVRGVVCLKV